MRGCCQRIWPMRGQHSTDHCPEQWSMECFISHQRWAALSVPDRKDKGIVCFFVADQRIDKIRKMGIITFTGWLRRVSAFKSLYFIAFSNLGQNRFVTKVSQLWICKLFFIYLSLPASLPSPGYQCSKLFRRKLNRYVSTKGQRIFLLFYWARLLNKGEYWLYNMFYLFILSMFFNSCNFYWLLCSLACWGI